MISRDKISLIHLAKAQLQMADDEYRSLLRRAAGVNSSIQLDNIGFQQVVTEFERLGFRSVQGRAQQSLRQGMATPAQISKIHTLWRGWRGGNDERALRNWLEIHFHVSHVRFLECYHAGKAIAVLLKNEYAPER